MFAFAFKKVKKYYFAFEKVIFLFLHFEIVS